MVSTMNTIFGPLNVLNKNLTVYSKYGIRTNRVLVNTGALSLTSSSRTLTLVLTLIGFVVTSLTITYKTNNNKSEIIHVKYRNMLKQFELQYNLLIRSHKGLQNPDSQR